MMNRKQLIAIFIGCSAFGFINWLTLQVVGIELIAGGPAPVALGPIGGSSAFEHPVSRLILLAITLCTLLLVVLLRTTKRKRDT